MYTYYNTVCTAYVIIIYLFYAYSTVDKWSWGEKFAVDGTRLSLHVIIYKLHTYIN